MCMLFAACCVIEHSDTLVGKSHTLRVCGAEYFGVLQRNAPKIIISGQLAKLEEFDLYCTDSNTNDFQ